MARQTRMFPEIDKKMMKTRRLPTKYFINNSASVSLQENEESETGNKASSSLAGTVDSKRLQLLLLLLNEGSSWNPTSAAVTSILLDSSTREKQFLVRYIFRLLEY
jgi:hypothetical protein